MSKSVPAWKCPICGALSPSRSWGCHSCTNWGNLNRYVVTMRWQPTGPPACWWKPWTWYPAGFWELDTSSGNEQPPEGRNPPQEV